MDKCIDYIEMKIPAKTEYIGIVRLTLSGIANRMGYTYDDIEDLKIAVSEACSNAVQHAYGHNENGEVRIGFSLFENRLEITVSDDGKNFDLSKMKENTGPYSPSMPIEKLSEGGLGLFLIKTLMDEVTIDMNSGVTVKMSKLLNEERMRNEQTSWSKTKQ
ncbi:anti-sigma B factor RsbW [Aeribacillus composti]|uniref:anti-sigma B factor RsbW n=1 Tax=Aeribacillus TaxID=1055323 RepID=UPI001198DA4D|nr:anti-sigma B factor RsbW [Aeribacillus composti]TVZ87545.1 serine/threonine-protein kinase RsbW [Aeribacillus composti]